MEDDSLLRVRERLELLDHDVDKIPGAGVVAAPRDSQVSPCARGHGVMRARMGG